MSASADIRVLIVDDHPLMRVGVAAIINAQADMTVVAQAGEARESVRLFEAERPSITLMDLRLPDMNGVEAIRPRHRPGGPRHRPDDLRGRRGYPPSTGGGRSRLHDQGDVA